MVSRLVWKKGLPLMKCGMPEGFQNGRELMNSSSIGCHQYLGHDDIEYVVCIFDKILSQ
ncbi:MAG: hypothetical protein ACE5GV_13815 [Candidatus Scalindua sp.]